MAFFGVNDTNEKRSGTVEFKILNSKGEIISSQITHISVEANWEKLVPLSLEIPKRPGGYMLISELDDGNKNTMKQVSRRYIRVGNVEAPEFFEYSYGIPVNWPESRKLIISKTNR